MKIVQNCTAIAAALSLSYRQYDDSYDPKTGVSLEEFLDSNGILLTICMRYRGLIPWQECSRGRQDSKLSASWVQREKTRGFHTIGTPIDVGPPVGLVLKPTATIIRCLFPADAATDGRDDDGCGPAMNDVRYGSKGYDHVGWFKKQLLKAEVRYYKNSVFGANRTFESIPCDEFFISNASQIQGPNPPVLGRLNEDSEWNFETLTGRLIDEWSYIMGHSVCNTSQPVPKPNLDNTTARPQLFYQEHKSWRATEWADMVRLMEQALDEHPSLDVWNELVLKVPTGDTEASFANHTVQAVFFIKGRGVVMDEIARRIAKREAKRMIKPLMYIDLDKFDNDNHDLFICEGAGGSV